jgi:hypothetical protein
VTRDGKLRVHQVAGARLSGVMGKGKGEAWAPATLFISHIVLLSRPNATDSHGPVIREHFVWCGRRTQLPLVLFAQLR